WWLTGAQTLFAGVGKAFRAPNLTNLTGIQDRGSNGVDVLGNGSLDPEVSYTVDLGWTWQVAADVAQVSVFHTTVDDLIQPVYRDDNDDGIIDDNDSGQMSNVEDATLRGFEVAVDLGLPLWLIPASDRLAFVGSASFVDAEYDLNAAGEVITDNISRANRLYGRLGVEYRAEAGWWLRPQLRWHAAYDEVALQDGGDVRLTMAGGDDGSMPGYVVADLGGGWGSADGATVAGVNLENLGNITYREPGSATDGSGFNVAVNVRHRF
ncbi:MAG: TonB-dependent receptor, partial [Planctomycetota bacterium]